MVTRIFIGIVIVLWCVTWAHGRRPRIPVRLEGGSQPYAGRVMVYYRGVWGSICENGWTKTNAQVICRQLGYEGVVLTTKGKFFGEQALYTRTKFRSRYVTRRTRIWLDRITCTGREFNFGQCLRKRNRWGQVRCSRKRLAGVMCDPGMENLIKKPPLQNVTKNVDMQKFDLNLLPESNKSDGIITEGVLVLKYEGREGVVCSDDWDLKESRVACGELGFTHVVETTTRSVDHLRKFYSSYTNFYLGKVDCTGNEATILSCKSSGLRHQNCSSGHAVWVRCETRNPPFAHARLHGGVESWEGRIEVRKRTNWYTLCDKDLDIYTANVICRSLGYGTAKEYALGTIYPHALEDMGMYETIKCIGKEVYLQNCLWTERKETYQCKHYSDAGVKCNVPKRGQRNKIKIRLSGSRFSNRGRVDVMINGKWGMICGDRWTMKNSMVVCRQLGLGFAAANYSSKHFGRIGKVLLSGITCHGNETSLEECLRHDNLTCSQTIRIAAVICRKEAPDLQLDIKELEKTLQIRNFPIVALRCAHEENCLASSADEMYSNIELRRAWFGYSRRLMRFSVKVHNVGTAAYRPYLPKRAWQWHSCHRHYHSDEEFAYYDLIDPHTHKKLAEGHKASYCLEDTKCDDGVDQFYFCRNRGDQGISINCHDNYDYTLDCQWVDITDLKVNGQSYKLRVIANPAFKVGESDYTNNVVLCDLIDRLNRVEVKECIQETCETGVRSHHGNGNFACCRFPFVYNGESYHKCLFDDKTGQFWCGTTTNYDQDKLFGYC